MRIHDVPSRYLPHTGILTILLGLIAITHSVRQLRSNPNPDAWTCSRIISLSILGALMFQLGIGFCMASTVFTGPQAQQLNPSTDTPSADEKPEQTDCQVQAPEHSEEPQHHPSPINLTSPASRNFLLGLTCLALAASLQFAAAITRTHDDAGALALKTWKFASAVAAAACHVAMYLGALWAWCRALRRDGGDGLAGGKLEERVASCNGC